MDWLMQAEPFRIKVVEPLKMTTRKVNLFKGIAN